MVSTRTSPGVRLTLLKDEKATTGDPPDLGTRLISMTFEDCDDKADKLSLQLESAFDSSREARPACSYCAICCISWNDRG